MPARHNTRPTEFVAGRPPGTPMGPPHALTAQRMNPPLPSPSTPTLPVRTTNPRNLSGSRLPPEDVRSSTRVPLWCRSPDSSRRLLTRSGITIGLRRWCLLLHWSWGWRPNAHLTTVDSPTAGVHAKSLGVWKEQAGVAYDHVTNIIKSCGYEDVSRWHRNIPFSLKSKSEDQ